MQVTQILPLKKEKEKEVLATQTFKFCALLHLVMSKENHTPVVFPEGGKSLDELSSSSDVTFML